jgi:hypothetical protein
MLHVFQKRYPEAKIDHDGEMVEITMPFAITDD